MTAEDKDKWNLVGRGRCRCAGLTCSLLAWAAQCLHSTAIAGALLLLGLRLLSH